VAFDVLIHGMTEIEKNTNQSLRQKYFTDSEQILKIKKAPARQALTTSRIIDSSQVTVKGSKHPIRPGSAVSEDIIKVQVVRDDDVVKSIKIKCPCGRTADLDCEYSPEI
jgi:hypothetical protein